MAAAAIMNNRKISTSRPRFDDILHTGVLITTCPGIDIALDERVRLGGKAGFGVLHATQSIGHAARLLYFIYTSSSIRGVCGTFMVDKPGVGNVN